MLAILSRAKIAFLISFACITVTCRYSVIAQWQPEDQFTISVADELIHYYSPGTDSIRLAQGLSGASSQGAGTPSSQGAGAPLSQGAGTPSARPSGSSVSLTSSTASNASTPNVIGDTFDGGSLAVSFTQPLTFSFFAPGMRVGTGSGQPIYAFERDGMAPVFNDIVTSPGTGIDASGDGVLDTFDIEEPIPPSEAPTSPGPGFTFDGGTATYTNSTSSTTAVDGVPMDGQSWFINYSYSPTVIVLIPSPGGGVAVRRFKIAENNNPMPRDRFFFNYSFFNDVQANFGDISRYSLGFERTFFNGNSSFEFRLPLAATLASAQDINLLGDRDFEFGNVLMIYKLLLWRNQRFGWSTGTGISLPTASSTDYSLGTGNQVLHITNQAVHFLPFLGFVYNSGRRFFHESFLQCDFDPYGNPVFADINGLSGSLDASQIGIINDASLLFVDATFGYWLINDPSRRGLTRLAPVAEFHYSTTMNSTDFVSGNGLAVGDITSRFDILNLTLGTHVRFGRNLEIAAGVTVPLRDDDDEPFNYEGLVQVNLVR